ESIQSTSILGHIRYSTTGTSSAANAQPFLARSFDKKGIAVAHNGNLTNTRRLRNQQLREGQIFHTTSDTEIILSYLFRYRKEGLVRAIKKTMTHISGAYAVVVSDEERMVAFRDPGGYRPLVIGKLGDAIVFSSETAALDTVGADFVREIEPGEIVSVSPDGINSTYGGESMAGRSLCIFEYVYFARPDSIIDGHNVHTVRKAIGILLAGRLTVRPDIVIPSPDSGVSAAMGLAEALELPLEWAIYRNPYLGRTFITPNQKERELAVRLKFNPIGSLLKGKKVAIVDDSLVRGTTARVLTDLLKKAGAAEIHLCIASPPYKNPCYYGIDIPVAEDLAVPDADFSKLARRIGVDSLTFAEPDDLYQALGKKQSDYCSSCFTNSC
ncbi:MAG: amidophosphoribosyltransferase, partial [Bacillota bacterium]